MFNTEGLKREFGHPFSGEVVEAINIAEREAKGSHLNYIGTGPLLVGLLSLGAPRGVTAVGLGGDKSVEQVRNRLGDLIGKGSIIPNGDIPLSIPTERVIELSIKAAMELDKKPLSLGHVWLGIIRDGLGVAAMVLSEQGLSLERMQAEIVSSLRG